MRTPLKATAGLALLCALALAGCGGSSSSNPTLEPIAFKSAAIDGPALPALYTCDGKDIAPPLEWGTVPTGTGSLVLFVVGVLPEPSTKTYAISVYWAVAGINPALHKLNPGKLPAGAYQGTTSSGKHTYTICPKKGHAEQYQFELYALPAKDKVIPKFSGLPLLTRLADTKVTPATAHGAFVATYKRA
jgi:phosphatidylethanolamine-binding protein (PEBP) family uncharacterized protein